MMLATFPTRALSLLLFSKLKPNRTAYRILSLIPVAVLSAICSPYVFLPSGQWQNPLITVEVWATLGAIVFARFGPFLCILVAVLIYISGKLILI